MKRTFKQLGLNEREQLDVLRRSGLTLNEIAQKLGYHKSTISREIKRNSSNEYGCYVSSQANNRSIHRKSESNRHERLKDPRIIAYVREKILEHDWSPEIISGRISHDLPGLAISHEAIYQYIYSLQLKDRIELVSHMARSHHKRTYKTAGRKHALRICNRVSIEFRPKIVDLNIQPGHWETDSLISRQSKAALNSLSERTTRFVFITKLDKKTARNTVRAVVSKLKPLHRSLRRTITMDNGTENAFHEQIARKTGANCFFAHPFSAHERGSNEHINGLIRRYLPKKTDFAKVPKELIAFIQDKLNNRPRKCLKFNTPNELFDKLFVAFQH
jgi:IS30 family transposase